jgi:hypothetical protein
MNTFYAATTIMLGNGQYTHFGMPHGLIEESQKILLQRCLSPPKEEVGISSYA